MKYFNFFFPTIHFVGLLLLRLFRIFLLSLFPSPASLQCVVVCSCCGCCCCCCLVYFRLQSLLLFFLMTILKRSASVYAIICSRHKFFVAVFVACCYCYYYSVWLCSNTIFCSLLFGYCIILSVLLIGSFLIPVNEKKNMRR